MSDPHDPARAHPAVRHPVRLRVQRHRGGMGRVGRVNDWLATHLAVVFGVCWTIWVFFTVPVVAYFLPAAVQNRIFFFSSGWIQLFALPLMVYVGNKLQRSSDAQSEVIHAALTHIATVSDRVADLLNLITPGGLAAVMDETRRAVSASEAALAEVRALIAISGVTGTNLAKAAPEAAPPMPAGGPGTSGRKAPAAGMGARVTPKRGGATPMQKKATTGTAEGS
jgi:hypothetical protein